MIASKLESALSLAKRGFKVFPLVPNSKLPLIKEFPTRATTDENTILNWWKHYPQANIGISTNDLLVVDVDVKNNGIESVLNLVADGKSFPPTVEQTTASGGFHLIFSAPYPVQNSASKIAPGIDTRGVGGYIVGAGSTIDGIPYKIKNDLIAAAPDWLLESINAANTEAPQAHVKIEGIDPDKAKARAIKWLNERETDSEGNRNHMGYVVAAKLKDFGLDKEDTYLMMHGDWRCEPALSTSELKAVINSAYKYGKEAQGSAAPEAMFTPAEEKKEAKDEHPFEILNKDYSFVTIGSSHRVMYETTDGEGKFKLDFYNEDTFHKKLAARKFQTPDGNQKPLTKAWMTSHLRRSYDGLAFSPGIELASNYYNLWRGFSVEPLKDNEKPTKIMTDSVAKFEEHLLSNVCDYNLEDYNWVYGWFAHIIQKPWEKPGVALVLKGRKGVGKNVLFDSVGELFNQNYMVTAKRRYLIGNFNGHMEHRLMIVLDEAFWSGSSEENGILKALVTENEITIERKGLETYEAVSRLRVGIIGNEEWLVPASHDERRYAVFNVGEGRKQDIKFFTDLREGMEAGGYRYLLTKLLNFDISKINVRQAPNTEGLRDQKRISLSPVQKFFMTALENGYFEGISSMNDGSWMTNIDFKNFIDTYIASLKQRRGSVWVGSNNEVIKAINEFMPSAKIVKGTSGLSELKLPELSKARKEWVKTMGIDLQEIV